MLNKLVYYFFHDNDCLQYIIDHGDSCLDKGTPKEGLYISPTRFHIIIASIPNELEINFQMEKNGIYMPSYMFWISKFF